MSDNFIDFSSSHVYFHARPQMLLLHRFRRVRWPVCGDPASDTHDTRAENLSFTHTQQTNMQYSGLSRLGSTMTFVHRPPPRLKSELWSYVQMQSQKMNTGSHIFCNPVAFSVLSSPVTYMHCLGHAWFFKMKPTKKKKKKWGTPVSCVSSCCVFFFLSVVLFYFLHSLTSVKLSVGVFCIRIFVTLVCCVSLCFNSRWLIWSSCLMFLCVRWPSDVLLSERCNPPKSSSLLFRALWVDFHADPPCLGPLYTVDARRLVLCGLVLKTLAWNIKPILHVYIYIHTHTGFKVVETPLSLFTPALNLMRFV